LLTVRHTNGEGVATTFPPHLLAFARVLNLNC
jgi:hypothetical protein